ncbi:MAG: HNH endonuclease [Chthonomonadaceae bacterium]|nr:HNH endonuclease [Chthonomonadaceae bacterium]
MARFTRTSPAPFLTKTYSKYRSHVRADFEQCCAYCHRHEDWAGEEEVFEIDHFRPQDKFPHLISIYENLCWSCRACNGRKSKSHHWPTYGQLVEGSGFVDLCADDWEQHYEILPNGNLKGLTKQANYTIKMIRLNRETLVRLRRFSLAYNVSLDQEREISFPLPPLVNT